MNAKSKTTIALTAAAVMLTTAPLSHSALIGFNAENGSSTTTTVTSSLGSDYPVVSNPLALGGQGVAVNARSPAPAGFPGDIKYTVRYDILFAETGNYNLYARIQVPSNGTTDSFFYTRAFGAPNFDQDGPTIGWATMNDLNGTGTAGAFVWVNLSTYNSGGSEAGSALNVATTGVKEFYIGGRETGLFIDALAFGTVGETFSDAQLSASVVPEPTVSGLVLLGTLGAALRRRRA